MESRVRINALRFAVVSDTGTSMQSARRGQGKGRSRRRDHPPVFIGMLACGLHAELTVLALGDEVHRLAEKECILRLFHKSGVTERAVAPLSAVQAPLLDRLGLCHDARSQGLVGRYVLPVKKKSSSTP